MAKKEKIINFNRLARSDKSANFFGELHNSILKCDDVEVIVCDLTEYEYIHASYAVLVASSIYVGKKYNKRVIIRYDKSNNKAVEFLSRAGLINKDNSIPKSSCIDENNVRFVRLKTFKQSMDITKRILDSMPIEMTDEVKNAFMSRISEIFSNAFTHGENDIGVFCCGFMNDERQFTFSVYDVGVGIKNKVTSYLKRDMSATDALKWALERGNSTLNGKKDYPRGAGLELLQSFVKLNDGKINIISDRGYCQIEKDSETFTELSNCILGTIFSMTILADTKHKYTMGRK